MFIFKIMKANTNYASAFWDSAKCSLSWKAVIIFVIKKEVKYRQKLEKFFKYENFVNIMIKVKDLRIFKPWYIDT